MLGNVIVNLRGQQCFWNIFECNNVSSCMATLMVGMHALTLNMIYLYTHFFVPCFLRSSFILCSSPPPLPSLLHFLSLLLLLFLSLLSICLPSSPFFPLQGSHVNINPHGIVAIGPELNFSAPHNRASKFGN